MSSEKIAPTYLGDAVYGSFDGYHVNLTLNDHRNERAVALEYEVWMALVRYGCKCFGVQAVLTAPPETKGDDDQQPF